MRKQETIKDVPVCPICARFSSKKKYPLLALPSVSVYTCYDCTSEFLFPLPSNSNLRKIYENDYKSSWGYNDNVVNDKYKYIDIIKQDTFQILFIKISEYMNLKKEKRILDIGCANGSLLEVARNCNFIPYGIEISSFFYKIAKQKFPQGNIFHGTIEQADFEREYFDLITMSDLIEHVPQPLEIMKKCFEFLKPDGLLAIVTPDKDSVYSTVMGRHWIEYKIEHLTYLNKRSLNVLGRRSGFKIVYSSRFVKTMNFDYLHHQSGNFRNRLISPLVSCIYKIIPDDLKFKSFPIYLGNICMFYKKAL